ncbi:hypothetical protein BBI10_17935 [Pseudomonas graminis]|uniref:Uncharacterized protein n=2 Tax=Pseudomonas graminis TaxID=158627 RepID=A0A1C2DRK2_9PSED|nr:hypothetical protein BBI10_17935 [Pseudomonas graminis]
MNPLGLELKAKKVVYVGEERFTKLMGHAIELSNNTRVQITTTQFAQHLVDHYSELALANWMQTLAAAAVKNQPGAQEQAETSIQNC